MSNSIAQLRDTQDQPIEENHLSVMELATSSSGSSVNTVVNANFTETEDLSLLPVAIPSVNLASNGGPFDRLISAALSTLLVFLLAWRFLLSEETSRRRSSTRGILPTRSPHSLTRDNTPVRQTAATSQEEQKEFVRSEGSGFPADKEISIPVEVNCTSAGENPESEQTSSTRRPLVTSTCITSFVAPTIQLSSEIDLPDLDSPSPTGFTLPVIPANQIMDMIVADSDDSSDRNGPPYLDTITEEDTDDLMSLSSGKSSPNSRIKTNVLKPQHTITVQTPHQHQIEVGQSASSPLSDESASIFDWSDPESLSPVPRLSMSDIPRICIKDALQNVDTMPSFIVHGSDLPSNNPVEAFTAEDEEGDNTPIFGTPYSGLSGFDSMQTSTSSTICTVIEKNSQNLSSQSEKSSEEETTNENSLLGVDDVELTPSDNELLMAMIEGHHDSDTSNSDSDDGVSKTGVYHMRKSSNSSGRTSPNDSGSPATIKRSGSGIPIIITRTPQRPAPKPPGPPRSLIPKLNLGDAVKKGSPVPNRKRPESNTAVDTNSPAIKPKAAFGKVTNGVNGTEDPKFSAVYRNYLDSVSGAGYSSSSADERLTPVKDSPLRVYSPPLLSSCSGSSSSSSPTPTLKYNDLEPMDQVDMDKVWAKFNHYGNEAHVSETGDRIGGDEKVKGDLKNIDEVLKAEVKLVDKQEETLQKSSNTQIQPLSVQITNQGIELENSENGDLEEDANNSSEVTPQPLESNGSSDMTTSLTGEDFRPSPDNSGPLDAPLAMEEMGDFEAEDVEPSSIGASKSLHSIHALENDYKKATVASKHDTVRQPLVYGPRSPSPAKLRFDISTQRRSSSSPPPLPTSPPPDDLELNRDPEDATYLVPRSSERLRPLTIKTGSRGHTPPLQDLTKTPAGLTEEVKINKAPSPVLNGHISRDIHENLPDDSKPGITRIKTTEIIKTEIVVYPGRATSATPSRIAGTPTDIDVQLDKDRAITPSVMYTPPRSALGSSLSHTHNDYQTKQESYTTNHSETITKTTRVGNVKPFSHTIHVGQPKSLASPIKTKISTTYSPEPVRINPPVQYGWKEITPQSKMISPQYISSEHLQKLLEDPYYLKKQEEATVVMRRGRNEKDEMKLQYLSAEHLQKLLEDPYYIKGQSKSNLNQGDATVSPPLSQQNLALFASMPENATAKQQHLLRWRNSMNLTDNDLTPKVTVDENATPTAVDPSPGNTSAELGRMSPYSTTSNSDAITKERTYQRKLQDDEANQRDSRRSRYKAKIAKAKDEFVKAPAQGSVSDLYKTPEEFEKKFRVSMESVLRPYKPARGPLIQKHNDPNYRSKIDISEINYPKYPRMPPSRYDKEYLELVKQAEETWANYRRRVAPHKENLYARNRAVSTGYLETNVDTGEDVTVTRQMHVQETDLDIVHKSAQPQPVVEHDSRSRQREEAKNSREAAHLRARSVDYLMDSRAREEIEPPENQLRKILGDASQPTSEHEMRFRKSTEKLLVPNWYINSDFCPGGKLEYDADGLSNRSFGSVFTAATPETPVGRPIGHTADRPLTAQANYIHMRDNIHHRQPPIDKSFSKQYDRSPTHQKPPEMQIRRAHDAVVPGEYESPFVIGGKISGTEPPLNRNFKRDRTSSSFTGHKTRDSRNVSLPRGMFDKYKEEIEDLRKSRDSLSHLQQVQPELYRPPSAGIFDRYKDEIEDFRRSKDSLSHLQQTAETTLVKTQSHSYAAYQSNNLPIATVKPRPQGIHDHSSSSLSREATPEVPEQYISPITKPLIARPNQLSTPYNQQSSPALAPMSTSTPFSSDKLARKEIIQQPSLRPDSSLSYNSPAHESIHKTTHTTTIVQKVNNRSQPDMSLSYDQDGMNSTLEEPPIRTRDTPMKSVTYDPKFSTSAVGRTIDPPPSVNQQHPGWTVSAPPKDWNLPGTRNSRVIEVGDTFFDKQPPAFGRDGRRLVGNVTLEEVLDSLLALPGKEKRLSTLDESNHSLNRSLDTSLPQLDIESNIQQSGIFAEDLDLMERCKNSPQDAENLLNGRTLWVRCAYSGRTEELSAARRKYVTCKHCYSYYYSREYRKSHWPDHKNQCNFARVNTCCKEIIMKVRTDPEAQWQMSRVARQGYTTRGRGSVNFRFRTPELADIYLKEGYTGLSKHPANYLYYYTVPDLIEGKKDPSLIALCRRYDPRAKFILSVSIVADIENCPETPRSVRAARIQQPNPKYSAGRSETPNPPRSQSQQRELPSFTRTQSLPHNKRATRRGPAGSSVPDTGTLLQSVLRSMENIAPGPPEVYKRPDSASSHRISHYNSNPLFNNVNVV